MPRADSTIIATNLLHFGTNTGALYVTNYYATPIITNVFVEGSTLIARINDLKVPFSDQAKTNLIAALVASGTFCQVRGHAWEGGCGVAGCLVVHNGPMRHCPICGKVETQQIGPWK